MRSVLIVQPKDQTPIKLRLVKCAMPGIRGTSVACLCAEPVGDVARPCSSARLRSVSSRCWNCRSGCSILGACSYLNIAVAARVGCGSLRALKTLLESFVRSDAQAVVEAQHHPFPSGGADARQTDRNTDRAIQAVPPSSASSSRGQAEDDRSTGAITAAHGKTPRGHGCRGDES